ncbi:hypothetical protein FSP39_011364 [Pinctada imbricata]|uniref:Carbonic anhydrase n=1 Tax=Pinctada imbricata TaxID=66713 RepID=A0AA88XKF4_PINIB|nr:hypothetical protein FSP39_011364 [Pinctada imbricata]
MRSFQFQRRTFDGLICSVSRLQHQKLVTLNKGICVTRCHSNHVGSYQSPVDIASKSLSCDTDLKNYPLQISYQVEKELDIENNGYTVVVPIKQNSFITGGPLQDRYRLIQFHLHWGCSNDRGSEHTVDGQVYAGEIHLVHWNTDKYGSFQEALTQPDGLAVLGAVVKIGRENPGMKLVVDNMDKVVTSGSRCTVPSQFDPQTLLSYDISKYWTYPGSLTTPEYNESVTWIVFCEPFVISQNQMDALRSLRNPEGKCICDNFRDVKPLSQRCIRASF